ncbi:hypothetical protein RSOLAG1IB_01914 [Rhizoctonia solani AG-1 IB]|uniref:Uncharacterized protein n=1 Tax=Thanatephorus cucumeris (strain AG1-IB / isolate 7/3/14) TaxID=1108050 RepID=A0A0B7FIA6_THACB|nr:hypothetical protein RSOLAG1IB_01914 [Rhizoctonia solani AG-1 IB]
MPTAKSSSSTARGGKARPRTSTNQAPPPASTSSPKKRDERKAGARTWTITDYLLVFQIISAVRPSGSNEWEGSARGSALRKGNTAGLTASPT